MILWVIFLITHSFQFSRNCPKYTTNTSLPFPACAAFSFVSNTTLVTLNSCPASQVCDLTTSASESRSFHCQKYFQAAVYYPGEHCENGSECFSGVCRDCVCEGVGEDGGCGGDVDCGPGLFCLLDKEEKGSCKRAGKVGENCSEKKCRANLVCDSNVCTRIGSRKRGEKATIPSACETFYIKNSKCTEGPKLINSGAKNPAECKYKDTAGDVTRGVPVCGMNVRGDKYCALGEGDVELKKVLVWLG